MTPRERYEADRREGVSPPWEDLGPETRAAYENNAIRYRKMCAGPGVENKRGKGARSHGPLVEQPKLR
jgi:hypothetical protein